MRELLVNVWKVISCLGNLRKAEEQVVFMRCLIVGFALLPIIGLLFPEASPSDFAWISIILLITAVILLAMMVPFGNTRDKDE